MVQRSCLFLIVIVVLGLMIAATQPVSAQEADYCNSAYQQAQLQFPVDTTNTGYGWSFQGIDQECNFAYGRLTMWALSDSFNQSAHQSIDLLFWHDASGALFINQVLGVNHPGIKMAAAEQYGDVAAFYFVNFFPETSYLRVVTDRAGNTTTLPISASEVPDSIMQQFHVSNECGFPSEFQMWEAFARVWEVPADMVEVEMTSTTDVGVWENIHDSCRAGLTTFFVQGPRLSVDEYDYWYGVYFYTYFNGEEFVISQPISDSVGSYFRYPITFRIEESGLYVIDRYLTGEMHEVYVGRSGSTQETTIYKWESLINEALRADSILAIDPTLAAVPFSYFDVALRLPDEPLAQATDTDEWFDLQARTSFSFYDWVCITDDCATKLLTIYVQPNGTSYDGMYRWSVFAQQDNNGVWHLSDFVRQDGSAFIKQYAVQSIGQDALQFTGCSMADGLGWSDIWVYDISFTGEVTLSESEGVCPVTSLIDLQN